MSPAAIISLIMQLLPSLIEIVKKIFDEIDKNQPAEQKAEQFVVKANEKLNIIKNYKSSV